MKKKSIIALTLLLSILLGLINIRSIHATSKGDSCRDWANNHLKVNKANIMVYNQISDVDPDKESGFGVNHVCYNSKGTGNGVFFLTDSNGYSSNGNSVYTINVNSYIKKSGTHKMALMGLILGAASNVNTYAADVKLCARQNTDLCDSTIGIYKDATASSEWLYDTYGSVSGLGYYFLRASNGSNAYEFAPPVSHAKIAINADIFLDNATQSEIKTKVLETGTFYYREADIYAHRCFFRSDKSKMGECGWSVFKLVVYEDFESSAASLTPISTIRNKSRNGAETDSNATIVQTVNAHPNEVVTYKHYYTNLDGWSQTTTCRPTFNNASNGASVATGRSISFGNACTYAGVGTAGDGIKRFTNAGGSFDRNGITSGDFTIPSGAANKSTYCEQIGYDSLNNGDIPSANSAGVCARVIRPSVFSTKTEVTVGDRSAESDWDYQNGILTPTVTTNDASVTVRFSHSVRRTDVTDTYAEMTYNIDFTKSGGVSTKKNIRTDSSPYKMSANTTSGSISPEEYEITLRYGEEVTVCETITHSTLYYEDTASDTATASSKACVTIRRNQASCSINGESYGSNAGFNIGRVGVEKNEGSYTYTTLNRNEFKMVNGMLTSQVGIWARPFDSIRFEHNMCAGAQYAVTSNSISGHDADYTIYGTSSKSGLNEPGYLFGKDSSDDHAATKHFTISTASDNEGFLVTKYELTVQSPRNQAGDHYGCTSSFKQDHYQIPALVGSTSGCQVAAITRSSDVGNTITQRMTWNDVEVLSRNDGTAYISPSHNGSTYLKAEANVSVPYNYVLKPYASKMGNAQTAVPGGSFAVNTYVPVVKRDNKQVGSEYATITKPTIIRVVSFVLRGGLPLSSSKTIASSDTNANICAYATTSGTILQCNVIDTGLGNSARVLNNSGSTQLEGTLKEVGKTISEGGSAVKTVNISIPENDVYLGDKFCVAVAAWPSDSHNLGFATSVDDNDQSIALSDNPGAGAKWAVSAPNCVSIAKRPLFSVESSQMTVNGRVNTAKNKKGDRYFASWVEYGLVAKGNAKDMASGAASGYLYSQGLNPNNKPSNVADNTQYVYGLIGVNQKNINSGMKGNNPCTYHSQTIKNEDCTTPGNTSIEIEKTISNTVKSITDVYTRKGKKENYEDAGASMLNNLSTIDDVDGRRYNASVKSGYYDMSPRTAYSCMYDSSKGRYVADSRDNNRAHTIDGKDVAPFYCLSNGSKYYRVGDGQNGYIGSRSDDTYIQRFYYVNDLNTDEIQETYRNPTRVFHADGTIVIDTNIVISSKEKNAQGNIQPVDLYEDIQQIPQVIIIAKNIDITNTVTRIDAWLIAEDTINTCAYQNYSSFWRHNPDPNSGSYTYINAAGDNSSLSAKMCDKTLMINGPVFANKMILNRTAGAGTAVANVVGSYKDIRTRLKVNGDYANQRAEIFNLRSDSYLWGYYQAQRSSIMTTVFSRELPTRY